jgi:hypothetical protein
MGNPLVRFWRGAWWQLGDRKLPCLPDESRIQRKLGTALKGRQRIARGKAKRRPGCVPTPYQALKGRQNPVAPSGLFGGLWVSSRGAASLYPGLYAGAPSELRTGLGGMGWISRFLI